MLFVCWKFIFIFKGISNVTSTKLKSIGIVMEEIFWIKKCSDENNNVHQPLAGRWGLTSEAWCNLETVLWLFPLPLTSFAVIPTVPKLWTTWNCVVCGPLSEHCRDQDSENDSIYSAKESTYLHPPQSCCTLSLLSWLPLPLRGSSNTTKIPQNQTLCLEILRSYITSCFINWHIYDVNTEEEFL